MKNKKLICLTLITVFMIAGCSRKQPTTKNQNNIKITKSSIEEKKDNSEKSINPYNYKNLSSLPKKYTLDMAKENGDVVWIHKEIYNLEKLTTFMNNVENGINDMIRVVGFTIEGDSIIQDLEYNGEVINLTYDSTRDKFSSDSSIKTYEYRDIVIKQRYNEDYKGDFIEYYLKNNKEDDGGMFILQMFKKR